MNLLNNILSFLRHALGLLSLLVGAGLGYLSKWLIQGGAWLVDQEEHYNETNEAIDSALRAIYHKNQNNP